MFCMTITYGAPENPATFMGHYENVHMPLVRRIPGLVRATYGRCEDPVVRGKEPAHFLIATLEFADRPAFLAAMQSPEMAATGDDLKNFADGGVAMVVYQRDELTP